MTIKIKMTILSRTRFPFVIDTVELKVPDAEKVIKTINNMMKLNTAKNDFTRVINFIILTDSDKEYCVYSDTEEGYESYHDVEDLENETSWSQAEDIRNAVPGFYVPVIHTDGTYGRYQPIRNIVHWSDGHMDSLDEFTIAEYKENYARKVLTSMKEEQDNGI